MRLNRGGNVRFHFACAQVEQASFTRTASEVSRLFSCPFSQRLVAKLILPLFEIARVLVRHCDRSYQFAIAAWEAKRQNRFIL